MIQHILLWQFTEQAKAEGAAEKLAYLQRRFAALPGRIEGLRGLRLLPNVNGGPYDLALIAEFDSMEAGRRYQQHPLHLDIQQAAKDWVTGRACVDVEMP